MGPPISEKTAIKAFLEGQNPGYAMIAKWIDDVVFFHGWGSRVDVAEVKQDALVTVLENLRQDRYKGGGLKSYVQSTCKNLCLLALRRSYRHQTEPIEHAYSVAAPDNPESEFLNSERYSSFARVFSELTFHCKKLLILRFLHSLNYKEISERLEIAEGAARVRLFRCLAAAKDIRARLEMA